MLQGNDLAATEVLEQGIDLFELCGDDVGRALPSSIWLQPSGRTNSAHTTSCSRRSLRSITATTHPGSSG